jgi:TonB family protein
LRNLRRWDTLTLTFCIDWVSNVLFAAAASFVLLIATSTSGATAPTPTPTSAVAGAEELKQLRSELPKAVQYAKLLNPADLSNAMRYPEQARMNEEEGRVVTWLLIGTDGKTERCGVQVSSGSNALDDQTCSLLIANALFEPAKDENGTAVRSIFYQALTWELEDEPDPALIAGAEELERLDAELPKRAKKARLLNGTEVARAMDYPKKTLARGQAGTTTMLLLVGPEGRVERCAVANSSGSGTLDVQSCNLFIANAKYNPARDRRGRAIPSIFHQRLTWRLEDGPVVEIKDSASRITSVVDPENEVRSCKAELFHDEQWLEEPPSVCEEFLNGSTGVLAAAREKSKLHDALVVIESWSVRSAERAIPKIGRRQGEVLIGLRSATVSYDANGKRTDCEAGESYGFPEMMEDVCTTDSTGGVPTEIPTTTGAIENLRMVSALYLKDEPN